MIAMKCFESAIVTYRFRFQMTTIMIIIKAMSKMIMGTIIAETKQKHKI